MQKSLADQERVVLVALLEVALLEVALLEVALLEATEHLRLEAPPEKPCGAKSPGETDEGVLGEAEEAAEAASMKLQAQLDY